MSLTALEVPQSLPSRPTTSILPPVSDAVPSFIINSANRSYKHQYSNIYFLRLHMLKEEVERRAHEKWEEAAGSPTFVPRVLEVTKGKLSYIIGTVYLEMRLKPNILEDIARDRSLPQPPPPLKLHSSDDQIMLEDESGRIPLVGERMKRAFLVTGVIISALGIETPAGEFEVVDICFPGFAPQRHLGEAEADKMDIDHSMSESVSSDKWLALVSGLDVGSDACPESQIQLLIEYLTGEQSSDYPVAPSCISRLIVVGNSLAPYEAHISNEPLPIDDGKKRRYGQDTTIFSSHPTASLSAHLLDIGQTLPIHMVPGANDPSGTILPQQPFPRAMFGSIASYATFSCETNPTYLHISVAEDDSQPQISCNLLINSGQPLNDMYRYLPCPPVTRLSILESTLRWRHQAPTAPDTLWCHPYFLDDPFIIKETPDLYIVGAQPQFGTKIVVDSEANGDKAREKRCRIVMVPTFAETGELVLVNLRTLDVKTIKFTALQ